MTAPALSIPIRANLDDFKAAMNNTTALANTAKKAVLKSFEELNAQLGGPMLAGIGASYARAALGIAGKFAVVVGTVKLMGAAVETVQNQIKAMVDVADKATERGLSPEFFQRFVEGAKGAQEQVTLFEGALGHAFQALKPVLEPNWSVWDKGLTKITAVEEAMRGLRELFSTEQDSSGLDLFRNAKDNDERIAAVLTFMKQLESIGQRVAALDLADKLFGSAFADRIRTGQESIDGLLTNIRTRSDNMFSNAAVLRAKELDDQLKEAWRTVDQNLHPSLEALDVIGLKIKSAWVEIVELMGKAAKLLPGIPAGGTDALAGTRAQETLLQNRLRDTGLTSTQRNGLEAQLRDVQSKLAQAEASQVPQAPNELGQGVSAETVPLPMRRPLDAPRPPEAAGVTRNRFDGSLDAIAKRTAALNAETQTIGLNTAAQERAKIAATLTATAMQLNAEAGRGANVVTEEQRKRIDEVADAYERATAGLEKMRMGKEVAFGRGSAFLSSDDVQIAQQLRGLYGDDIPTALASSEAAGLRLNSALKTIASTTEGTLTSELTNILDGTKSVSMGFQDMAKTIVRALEEAIVKMLVVQPIMRALSGSLMGFSGGGLVSAPALPAFADGGVISGPGTGRSDSIPAMVSNGEYIINAGSTAKHRPLLDAINADRLPRFADGGMVGGAADGPMMAAGPVIAPTVQVNVQGSPGMSAADHEAMGKRVGDAAMVHIQKMIGKELRTQTRPGGVLQGRQR